MNLLGLYRPALTTPEKYVDDNGLVETHSQLERNSGVRPEGGLGRAKELVGRFDASLDVLDFTEIPRYNGAKVLEGRGERNVGARSSKHMLI